MASLHCANSKGRPPQRCKAWQRTDLRRANSPRCTNSKKRVTLSTQHKQPSNQSEDVLQYLAQIKVMAEEYNDRRDRTIILTKLKPQEYRLWVITARATFDVHGVLDIVEGRAPDPTPVNPDGTPGAINTQLRSKIQKWKRNHGLAREALLKALEPVVGKSSSSSMETLISMLQGLSLRNWQTSINVVS